MCHRTTCRKCGNPTWSGCGNHIEQALAGVAKDDRCKCAEETSSASAGGGFMSRLRGR